MNIGGLALSRVVGGAARWGVGAAAVAGVGLLMAAGAARPPYLFQALGKTAFRFSRSGTLLSAPPEIRELRVIRGAALSVPAFLPSKFSGPKICAICNL
jgi:hypothetical protein